MTTKSSNRNLHKASQAKKDEFYTQLVDIEKELKHYKKQFRGKVVYCNCDDPFESNFFKYFAANFNELKLKKLIATSYVKSPIVGGQLPLFEMKGLKPDGKQPFKIEISKIADANADGAIDIKDIEWMLKHDKITSAPLKGDGDFRSEECIKLLKEADVVCTNPPFSLFREYVAQLVKHDKKFLIIGNLNAIKYNSIFKLVRSNKVWLGLTMDGRNKWFQVPDIYPIDDNVANSKIENGKKYLFVKGCMWFTNMDTEKRHQDFNLYKKYTPKEYPKYDNYDAIEVSKVADIPMDYKGVMGVPITFISKYNPSQFEILGIYDDKRENDDAFIQGVPTYIDEQHKRYVGPVVKGKALYTRVLIKNRKVKK